MATTQQELDLVFVEVGTEFKNVRGLIGALLSLNTADKSSLVAAINEVNQKTASAGASIVDTGSSTTSVYSSSKTLTEIEARAASLKAEILGGAGPTIDTLMEIATLLTNSDQTDDAAISALTDALGVRVRFDVSQTLTTEQKAQANENMGSVSLVEFGDPAHSYKDVFIAALA